MVKEMFSTAFPSRNSPCGFVTATTLDFTLARAATFERPVHEHQRDDQSRRRRVGEREHDERGGFGEVKQRQ
jgi:hypothetical protein